MGQLPPELGLLTNLEVLRIYSIPGLTGPIPDYSALTHLTYINLSGNNLTGAFPAWLDGLPALFNFPPDMARVPAEPNRLSNQLLVHLFEQEWGKVHQ